MRTLFVSFKPQKGFFFETGLLTTIAQSWEDRK